MNFNIFDITKKIGNHSEGGDWQTVILVISDCLTKSITVCLRLNFPLTFLKNSNITKALQAEKELLEKDKISFVACNYLTWSFFSTCQK